MNNNKQRVVVTTQQVNLTDAFAFVSDAKYGAISSFVGVIRAENAGKQVEKINYDVHRSMAEDQFSLFIKEAFDKYGEGSISMEHFHGSLCVGEISVAIYVGMPHRKEAIAACYHLIEALKHRAPIWKKEYYQDGESDWIKGCILSGEPNG